MSLRNCFEKQIRGHFDRERLEALIAAAEKTTGVPMTSGEQEKLLALVEQIEAQLQRLAAVDSKLR